MVDVIDGAFVIKQINSGIQGDFQPPANTELIEFAQKDEEKSGLSVPFGYAPAVFSRKLFENDFRKNLVCYEWTPDEGAWARSGAALRSIMRPYMMGVIKSFDDVLPRIDKTTSPGYPWNLKWKTKGEALEHGIDIFRFLVNQIQKTGAIDYHFEVRPGFIIHLVHTFYLTSGKGELRTVDKLLADNVEDRKTRTFMPGCLLLHIVSLMLYADQNDQMLLMAGEKEWSAVGMTPWYGGWNSMAEYLASGSAVPSEVLMICTDVRHMESSLNDCIQTDINGMRNENLAWGNELGTEVINMMTWYQEQSTQLYIIGVNGWLYFRCCVNPSGKFTTLTDNTIALMRVNLYVIACGCNTVAEVLAEYSRTPAKMMGDDSIMQYRPWMTNLISRARDLGFELKLEVPISPLRDAVFLNAGFHWSGLMWYFRPNYDKIRASIFFLWKSRSWRLAYVKVCAYRMMVFPFVEYRREADRLLRYIIEKHGDEMRNEHSMDSKITYHSAIASLMTDEENHFLTTGLESCRDVLTHRFSPGSLAAAAIEYHGATAGQSVAFRSWTGQDDLLWRDTQSFARLRPGRLNLFDSWVDSWRSADFAIVE